MPNEEDDRDPMLDEEHPGPQFLESALANTTLSEVTGLPPLTVLETTTVGDAVRLMQRERRACVLVVEDRRLIGIFTERDILMKVVAHPIDVERTPISTCMTRDPFTLPADANVAFALNKMVLEGFRHIPLVDENGRPIAVVSMRNVIEYLGEVYSREMVTIPPLPNQGPSGKREGA